MQDSIKRVEGQLFHFPKWDFIATNLGFDEEFSSFQEGEKINFKNIIYTIVGIEAMLHSSGIDIVGLRVKF